LAIALEAPHHILFLPVLSSLKKPYQLILVIHDDDHDVLCNVVRYFIELFFFFSVTSIFPVLLRAVVVNVHMYIIFVLLLPPLPPPQQGKRKRKEIESNFSFSKFSQDKWISFALGNFEK